VEPSSSSDNRTKPEIATFRVKTLIRRGAPLSSRGGRRSMLWAPGASRGTGQLEIAPGQITLTPSRSTRFALVITTVEHTATTITVLTARPGLPGWNTGVVLHDSNWTAVAVARFGAAGRLRAALARAGFSVRERLTFFSMSDRNEFPPASGEGTVQS